MIPTLEEIVRVSCHHRGIHADAAQREILDVTFATVTRARSKDAYTAHAVISAVTEAIKAHQRAAQ